MNEPIHLTDNLVDGQTLEGESKVRDILSIADIGSLKNYPELLVFPHSFADLRDGIDNLTILNAKNKQYDDQGHCVSVEVTTGNLMGFVGINDTSISIHSRFIERKDKTFGQDYFLYYMLQKVLSINVFNLDHFANNDDKILDFLLFLFPSMLKNALSQGLYKEYQTQHFDDARVKGVIEVNKVLRNDIPFRGRVSYRTRQYSYDNPTTQLIRHTIEYIKHHPFGAAILNNDQTTRECVSQIVISTPSYSLRDREKVIKENARPKVHPYFLKYRELQQLCLRILRHDSLKYGEDKNKVHGILFDGAWLWEEYLNTILKNKGFLHPMNKESKGGIRMFAKQNVEDSFDKNSRRLYPDFYRKDFILDAKYKHLNGNVGREDLYQVVTYMYCMDAPFGGYVYPYEQDIVVKKYKLAGMGSKYQSEEDGGVISVIPFIVPQQCDKWEGFIKCICESETKLKNNIDCITAKHS